MRYKATVSRVQTAVRYIRAADREAASAKLTEELARPYAFFGTWDTQVTDVDLAEAEEPKPYAPVAADGSLLMSLKDAAKHLGISYNTLYTLVIEGEIDHVQIGARRYVSREQLNTFIEGHTKRGF